MTPKLEDPATRFDTSNNQNAAKTLEDVIFLTFDFFGDFHLAFPRQESDTPHLSEVYSSTMSLVNPTQKYSRVTLNNTTLARLFRQVALDNNVILERPNRGPREACPPWLVH